MPENDNNPLSFFQELKRRKVIRVIIVYAAAAFAILELVSIIQEPFRLPEWTLRFVFIILCIGLIITIVLSWIYDIHPEKGIIKTEPAHKVKEEATPKSSNSWKIASYISFVVIIGLIVFNIVPRINGSEVKEIIDKSIAVIPFIDDSPNKDNEHIINGIMEDLLINLQSIKDLRVPGRTSTEQYRNYPKPIPKIAAEMNVAYIVEGSGQRYGNKIRLRVQLVEGETDKHIWADSYDEIINGPEDIFRIQSQIAKSIAAELQAIITPEEKQLIEKVPTTSLTAYDFQQRGIEEDYWYIKNGDTMALERAEDYFYKALEYDSSFAQAYARLAWVYWHKHYWDTYLSENFLDSVLILANIALSFDDQLSTAYIVRGDYYLNHSQIVQAINEYDKALSLNPNDWNAYRNRGLVYLYNYYDLLIAFNDLQKAASLHRGVFLPGIYRSLGSAYAWSGFKETSYYYAKEALKLDDDSAAYYGNLAAIEGSNGNFKNAYEFSERSYAIDSTRNSTVYYLGLYHSFLGQFEGLLEYMKVLERRLKAFDRPDPTWFYRIGYAYWVNGFEEKGKYYFNTSLEQINNLIELGRWSNQDLDVTYHLAAIYLFLGEKDKAYENLRLFNQRQRMPIYMVSDFKVDPMFDSIRDEPEFQQIVRDVEAKYQAEHERVRKWLEENDML